MKKKALVLIVLLLAVSITTACNTSKKETGKKFKKEYEALNGKKNSMGKEHRTITIDEDNPYEKVTPKDVVEMISSDKTFYLYVGDPLCPWCRSVLEKSIEQAKKHKVEKIYYIDIWDKDGNEILRDKYELKDNVVTKVQKGTEEYEKLLEYFDSVLKDYTLKDENGNEIQVGEKRIYAPNFFYIEEGDVKKMITGVSEKQKDAREELAKEILEDEEKQFDDFFK